jgi:hypothetical protein
MKTKFEAILKMKKYRLISKKRIKIKIHKMNPNFVDITTTTTTTTTKKQRNKMQILVSTYCYYYYY